MIRQATLSDLNAIMDMIKDVVTQMNSEGNDQWSSDYPLKSDFEKDVKSGTLHIIELDNEVKGIICVDSNVPDEYNTLKWPVNDNVLVVHRMAVGVNARGMGIGKKLLEFAENLAHKSGVTYLKTDTNSKNMAMNGLFIKLGYEKIGDISFMGRETAFYCYGKSLK